MSLPSTSLPTYQVYAPTCEELCSPGYYYLSVRIKIDHDQESKILEKVLHDVPLYCLYKHTTISEHFHICLPGYDTRAGVRFAKRIRDNFGVSGNGGYSIKSHNNGVRSFVFYCGHEGTEPVYSHEVWREVIASVTEYYVKGGQQSGAQLMLPSTKKGKDGDADWQLTYSNVVSKAVNHARTHALTGSLKEIVQDMCEKTKWRPSYHMIKNGVPDHYSQDFDFRSGKRQKFSMDWWKPRDVGY